MDVSYRIRLWSTKIWGISYLSALSYIVMVSVGVLHPCQSIKATLIFGVFGNSCSCWGPSSESGDSEKPVGRFPLHSEFRKPKTVLFAGHFLFGLSTTKLQIDLPVDWRIRGLGPPEGQLFYLHPPKKKWCWFFWRKTHPKRVFFGFWSSKLQQSPISSHLATVQQVAQELSESFPQPGVIILSTQTLDYYKGNPSKLP